MNYSRLADIRSHMGPKHTLGFINSFSSSISLFKSNHTCISVADAIQKKWDVIIWYFFIISSDKVLRSLYLSLRKISFWKTTFLRLDASTTRFIVLTGDKKSWERIYERYSVFFGRI